MNSFNKLLGQKICVMRKKHHLTQEGIVAKMQLINCNIIREAYVKKEIGICSFRLEELVALKLILGFDYDNIFGELEEYYKVHVIE